jgi:hypothetical protein
VSASPRRLASDASNSAFARAAWLVTDPLPEANGILGMPPVGDRHQPRRSVVGDRALVLAAGRFCDSAARGSRSVGRIAIRSRAEAAHVGVNAGPECRNHAKAAVQRGLLSTIVRLYTPVDEREATLAEQGRSLPGPRFWQTVVVRDEADENATWLVIDVPEAEALGHERATEPELGYREFELPADLVTRHAASRA